MRPTSTAPKQKVHLPGNKPAKQAGLADSLLSMAGLKKGPQALARIQVARVPADQAKPGTPPALSGGSGRIPAEQFPDRRQPMPAHEQEPQLDDSGRRAIVIGIGVMVAFFGFLGTWAAVVPLQGAATTSGVLVVEGSRKAIQHGEGGTIRKILVHEGDKVRAGQVLVELDDNIQRTNVAVLAQQYDALRAQVARLSAELESAAVITFPPDMLQRLADSTVAETVNGQKRLFAARRAAFEAQIAGMTKRISELNEQIRGSRAQNQSRAAQYRSVQSELDSIKPLVESGIVTRSRALELERNMQRLAGEEQEFSSKIGLDTQAIEQTKRQITQVESERVTANVAEMREAQNRIADIVQRLQSAQETQKLTRVHSPVAGTVMGLSVFTEGAVVARGEKFMEIVPEEKNLVVDSAVKVDDIAYVHVGMKAELRLTAFRQRNMPVIDGIVTYVAADRVTDPRLGTPQYPIKIKINPDDLRDFPEVSLYPGMAVMVFLPTGTRTALDYLISPLTESFLAAFREQ